MKIKLDKAAREQFRRAGKRGGLARAKALTAERRREIAKIAVTARIAKSGQTPA